MDMLKEPHYTRRSEVEHHVMLYLTCATKDVPKVVEYLKGLELEQDMLTQDLGIFYLDHYEDVGELPHPVQILSEYERVA